MSASGLFSKLSSEAVMPIQVPMCPFSSPACVSLALGYSEDPTFTLKSQFQVICWLHLQSTELSECQTTASWVGGLSLCHHKIPVFCPSASPPSGPWMLCKVVLCSEGAIGILSGQLKKWNFLLKKPPPSLTHRWSRPGPLDGVSNKTQCLELTNKSECKTIFVKTSTTWKYWQMAKNYKNTCRNENKELVRSFVFLCLRLSLLMLYCLYRIKRGLLTGGS